MIGCVCCRCRRRCQKSPPGLKFKALLGIVSRVYISKHMKNCLIFAFACWMPATSATNCVFYRPRLLTTLTHNLCVWTALNKCKDHQNKSTKLLYAYIDAEKGIYLKR